MFNNKLQVALSLTRRGWKGGDKCCLCGGLESVDHIFFRSFCLEYRKGGVQFE